MKTAKQGAPKKKNCKHKNWSVVGRIKLTTGAAQERKCHDCGLVILV